MIMALALTALFTIAATLTLLSLTDSWIRGRGAWRVLHREKALLEAGFVPQVTASEVRLRQPRRRTLAAASRPYSTRVPLPVVQSAS